MTTPNPERHTTPAHTTPEADPGGSGPIVTCAGMHPGTDEIIPADEPAMARVSQRTDDTDQADCTAVARRERSGRAHDANPHAQTQPAVNHQAGF